MTGIPREKSPTDDEPVELDAGSERAPGSCRCSACGKWFVPETESPGDSHDAAVAKDSTADDGSSAAPSSTYDPTAIVDEEKIVCPECTDRRTAMWVVGLFMLFFCFVVLPLLIQIFGTPRPTR